MVDYLQTAAHYATTFQDISGNNVKLILIPRDAYASSEDVSVSSEEIHTPLDLSCKPSGSSHDLLRRSSSSSSSDSGFQSSESSSFEDGAAVKKLKRREQNKAAAQAYRQRKKSISEMFENEYDQLLSHNKQLQNQKTKLEHQIFRMRQLLERIVEDSRRQEEEEHKKSVDESSCQSFQSEAVVTASDFNEDEHEAEIQNGGKAIGRSRQYTWPADGPTCPGIINRKKEQNRIASQRFRERRRKALNRCLEEVQFYEKSNAELRERCEILERKLAAIKSYFQRKNVMVPVFKTATPVRLM